MCSLSITSTARVRLPQVASMSSFLALASEITRFTGADSGLIIATTLADDTMFPNPMFMNFIQVSLLSGSSHAASSKFAAPAVHF